MELLREESGKNTKFFWDVSRVKTLLKSSRSICQIIINGNLISTGFLDLFVLTNAHVIRLNGGSVTNAAEILVNFNHKDGHLKPNPNKICPLKSLPGLISGIKRNGG